MIVFRHCKVVLKMFSVTNFWADACSKSRHWKKICMSICCVYCWLEESHRENTPSNKTLARAYKKYEYGHLGSWHIKSTIYMRFLYWKLNFRKRFSSQRQSSVLCDGSFFSPLSIFVNTSFWHSSFVKKCCVFNCSTFK